MRPVNTWLIPAAATLALGSAQSFACSCSTVVVDRSPDQEKQEWLESMALGSETVVLSRVTYVAPYSDGGGNAGDYGVLEVREILKGSPLPTIDVTTSRQTSAAMSTSPGRGRRAACLAGSICWRRYVMASPPWAGRQQ